MARETYALSLRTWVPGWGGGSCRGGEQDPGGSGFALASSRPGAHSLGLRGGRGTRGSPGRGLGRLSEPRAWRAGPVGSPQGRAQGLRGHVAGPQRLAERGARARGAPEARGVPEAERGQGKGAASPLSGRPAQVSVARASSGVGGGRGAAPFDQSKLNRRAK